MSANSKIEWCHHTFNPWWGCVKVSAECDNCYAEKWAERTGYQSGGKHFPIWGKEAARRGMSDAYWQQPRKWDMAAGKRGIHERVFCGSMCDVMERGKGDEGWGIYTIRRVQLYPLIEACRNLDWLLLTKRPQEYRKLLPGSWLESPLLNAWLGTTVGAKASLWRIDELRKTPASIRFLSVEPLLEDLGTIDLTGIHWVVVGGESGPGARPCNIEWIRSIVRQCEAASVPVFVKQMGSKPIAGGGEWLNWSCGASALMDLPSDVRWLRLYDRKGGDMAEWPEDLRIRRTPGKE